LGKGAVGKTYLVALKGTDKLYAMKVLTKEEMIVKNKVLLAQLLRAVLYVVFRSKES
jgi:protein-serine/threonine kinase